MALASPFSHPSYACSRWGRANHPSVRPCMHLDAETLTRRSLVGRMDNPAAAVARRPHRDDHGGGAGIRPPDRTTYALACSISLSSSWWVALTNLIPSIQRFANFLLQSRRRGRNRRKLPRHAIAGRPPPRSELVVVPFSPASSSDNDSLLTINCCIVYIHINSLLGFFLLCG
jgi:hypothetical protein